MSEYKGPERRKAPRVNMSFVVSYRILEEYNNHDLTQSKNVSQGGMLLTTNRYFLPGTKLVMNIRFPFLPDKIEIIGEVINSKEVVKNLIYETRIKFFGLNEKIMAELDKFIRKQLR